MTISNPQVFEQFAQAVGADVKTINSNIGTLTNLRTTTKGSMVDAINELKQEVQAAASSGGASINDQLQSTSTVYSSQKVNELIATATQQAITAGAAQAKNEILGGEVAAELDTLREIAQELNQGKTVAAGITKSLSAHGQRLTAMEAVFAQNLVQVYNTAKGGH